MTDLSWEEGGAEFNPDRTHRFRLWRRFDRNCKGFVCWVMLNPSQADDRTDDATIRRCIGYAKRWGYSGIEVVNLCSYISTEPRALRSALIGEWCERENLTKIVEVASTCAIVVLAWGCHGADHRDRVARVQTQLYRLRRPLFELARETKHGDPPHPLRLPADLRLRVRYRPVDAAAGFEL